MSATVAAFSAFLSIFSSFFLSPVANKKTSFAQQARRPLSHPARLRWTLSRSGRHQRSSAIHFMGHAAFSHWGRLFTRPSHAGAAYWSVSISGAVLGCVQGAANQFLDRGGA